MCGGVENAEAGEVGAKVMEVVYRTMNRHSASTRSSYTWSSSSTPWTTSAASTAPYPFHGAHTVPCTSCRSPRSTYALIYSMHSVTLVQNKVNGTTLHRKFKLDIYIYIYTTHSSRVGVKFYSP